MCGPVSSKVGGMQTLWLHDILNDHVQSQGSFCHWKSQSPLSQGKISTWMREWIAYSFSTGGKPYYHVHWPPNKQDIFLLGEVLHGYELILVFIDLLSQITVQGWGSINLSKQDVGVFKKNRGIERTWIYWKVDECSRTPVFESCWVMCSSCLLFILISSCKAPLFH